MKTWFALNYSKEVESFSILFTSPQKMDEAIKILASELQSAKEKLDEVKRRKTSIAVETTEASTGLQSKDGKIPVSFILIAAFAACCNSMFRLYICL